MDTNYDYYNNVTYNNLQLEVNELESITQELKKCFDDNDKLYNDSLEIISNIESRIEKLEKENQNKIDNKREKIIFGCFRFGLISSVTLVVAIIYILKNFNLLNANSIIYWSGFASAITLASLTTLIGNKLANLSEKKIRNSNNFIDNEKEIERLKKELLIENEKNLVLEEKRSIDFANYDFLLKKLNIKINEIDSFQKKFTRLYFEDKEKNTKIKILK